MEGIALTSEQFASLLRSDAGAVLVVWANVGHDRSLPPFGAYSENKCPCNATNVQGLTDYKGVDMTKRTCKIDGCEREVHSGILCSVHYKRERRGADMSKPIQKRFLQSEGVFARLTYTVSESGCWETMMRRNPQGYGQVWMKGKDVGVHRLAYETWVGPIPDGLHILHSCDNPPCINPAHLRLGTPADNAADRTAHGRQPRGVQMNKSSLTEHDVRDIRADPRTQRTIGAEYGLDHGAIGRIQRHQSWGHVS